MFVDLVGSTALSARLDPEDLREIIGAYHRCCAEQITKAGGFVAKYMGDGVLAYFGYPQAHEDDPERAVSAALALTEAVPLLRTEHDAVLQVRVGVATGLVVVGDFIGDGAAREQAVVGETPNVAARLQALAEPGQVVISNSTRRLTGGMFEYNDFGTTTLKGLAAPVRTWQVIGTSALPSRFDARHETGFTPLVGREEEFELLLRLWTRAKAGEGHVVLLSGEPGIGKSRLAAALLERLADEPHTRLRYFCSPQHIDSAFYPIIGQMERAARVARDDTGPAKLDKLDALLARTSTSAQDAALFAEMLSLPSDGRYPAFALRPQERRERTLEALTRQMQALTRQAPVLMILEDAHWADPTSLEALGRIVDRIRNLPLLLIATFRPEFDAPWTKRSDVTALTINQLAKRDVEAMIDQLVDNRLIDPSIRGDIIERTDGIPLFVEEMTRAVLEAETEGEAQRTAAAVPSPAVAVPASLHASLLARLDRLGPAKEVAQIGAAIGRRFSYELVAVVAKRHATSLDEALHRLVGAGLVFQYGMPPASEYLFKHALVQDTAYSTLLRGPRHTLHRRIASVLEEQFAAIVETQPEVAAHHFTKAGLVGKAATYWGKAGQRSAARSAMAEAAAQLNKGLDQLALLPNGPERQRQELEFYTALGAVLQAVKGYAAPDTGHAYARARDLWEQLGCPPEFLQVPCGQSRYHGVRGEFDLALRLDEDLLRLSNQRNDTAGLMLARYSSGVNLMFVGRFASSRLHLEAALAQYDPILHLSLAHQAGVHPHVLSEAYLGNTLFCLGFPDQAFARSTAAIAEASRLAHPPSLALSLNCGVRLLSFDRDHPILDQWLDQLIAVATDQGFPHWRALGGIYRGWLEVKRGDVTKGISLLRTGQSAYRATGAAAWMPTVMALLAKAHCIAGKIDETVTLLDDALQVVETTGERFLAAELTQYKGEVLMRRGCSEAAEELYRKALSIAAAQEARMWELRASTSLARLWRDQGKRTEARDLLAPIYGWFTEGFDTPDLKEAKALLDELAS